MFPPRNLTFRWSNDERTTISFSMAFLASIVGARLPGRSSLMATQRLPHCATCAIPKSPAPRSAGHSLSIDVLVQVQSRVKGRGSWHSRASTAGSAPAGTAGAASSAGAASRSGCPSRGAGCGAGGSGGSISGDGCSGGGRSGSCGCGGCIWLCVALRDALLARASSSGSPALARHTRLPRAERGLGAWRESEASTPAAVACDGGATPSPTARDDCSGAVEAAATAVGDGAATALSGSVSVDENVDSGGGSSYGASRPSS